MAAKKKSGPTGASTIHAAHNDPARLPFPEHQSLPLDGYSRWATVKRIVPLSHEAVRLRELKGRFPKRVQLGSARCVAWPNRELLAWLRDPAGYRAPGAAAVA